MDLIGAFLPFIVMIGIMYFLLIRPQKKQQEKTQNMLDSLKPGDSVVTIGGLHGVIDEINTQINTVVLDCEGIYLTFDRRAVARVLNQAQAEGVGVTTTDADELGTNTPAAEDEEDIVEE